MNPILPLLLAALFGPCRYPTVRGPNGEVAPCPVPLEKQGQSPTASRVDATAPATAPAALPSYTFKNFTLGMSLGAFKAAVDGEPVWIAFKAPNAKGKLKTVKMPVPTPLCTDTIDDFPGSDAFDRIPEEVICNVSPGSANQDQNYVAGGPVDQILYRFAKSLLYRIDLSFPASRYEVISSAFREKYGDPALVTSHEYQNGFGARWTGEALLWRRGAQTIALVEGSANGPAQLQGHSFGSFVDEKLRPKTSRSSNLDF